MLMQIGNLYAYCANNPVRYSDPSGNKVDLSPTPKQIAIDDGGTTPVDNSGGGSTPNHPILPSDNSDGEPTPVAFDGGNQDCENSQDAQCDPSGLLGSDNRQENFFSDALHGFNNLAVAAGIDTAGIGASVLDMYESAPGIYHARTDCWQQYFGYNDAYDYLFDLGTSMDATQFGFLYDGTEYAIWVWKGDYINLGAGAEMGIYAGGGPHWTAATDCAMDMSLSLSYKGQNILTHSQNTWWITGFNSNYLNVQAGDLTAVYTIYFNSEDMFYSFYNACTAQPGWIFNPSNLSAVFGF